MRFSRALADCRTTTLRATSLPCAHAALLSATFATLAVGCGGDKMPTGTSGVQDKSAAAVPTVDVAAPPATLVPSGTAASATASAGATASGVPDDMNVLVLGVDSLRVDHLPVGGAKEDVMPNLTAFEKTAVSYTHFYSVSSYTSQTLGAFLGARYPEELQRSGYFFGFYPDDELFFPELLQKAGVRTMSAQAHFYFAKEKSGFDQGFDVYELVPGLKKSNTTDENITSPAHTDLILKQLGDPSNTGKRFFAWYHLLDPHDQYMGHPEGKDFGRGAAKMYDGELYFVDMHLKKIFDYVDSQPWGKKTMIIVTSDHGEAFGEHKMYRHGFELWNMLTHVPLMIRAPGVKPRRIDTPRSGIDLPATILDVFHVAPDPSFHGESLVPELAGGEAAPRDVISDLARTSDNDRRRSLIRGNWKIIEGGDADGFQLFDLAADPEEKTDLARKEKAKFEEMREALKAASQNIKDRCPKNTAKLKGKKKTKPC